jgi:hypothetical protein
MKVVVKINFKEGIENHMYKIEDRFFIMELTDENIYTHNEQIENQIFGEFDEEDVEEL